MSQAARARGAYGERLAAKWYLDRGYELLDQNWRVRDGELDLVVALPSTLVFVEVKARASMAFGSPAEAVGYRKAARIRRLAAQWITAHDRHSDDIRFDVVSIVGHAIEVLEGVL